MSYPSDIQYIVNHLALEPHPEGGFFRETYRASENVSGLSLPPRFGGDRSLATAIYFLLGPGDFSAFHRIKSDETWHYYKGNGSLIVHILEKHKGYRQIKLGNRPEVGEVFQATVPAGAWFASEPEGLWGYALVGCTVSPGFDFRDFELADEESLKDEFPEQYALIVKLTR
jgi:uncharacterized protein